MFMWMKRPWLMILKMARIQRFLLVLASAKKNVIAKTGHIARNATAKTATAPKSNDKKATYTASIKCGDQKLQVRNERTLNGQLLSVLWSITNILYLIQVNWWGNWHKKSLTFVTHDLIMMNLPSGVQADMDHGGNLIHLYRRFTICESNHWKTYLSKLLTYHFRINFSVDFAVFIYIELTVWELKYLKIRFEDLKVNLFLLSGSFPRAKNVWTFNLLFRCHRIRIFWWFRYHRIRQIWTVESYYLHWWFSRRFGVDQSCWCEPLRPEFTIIIAV